MSPRLPSSARGLLPTLLISGLLGCARDRVVVLWVDDPSGTAQAASALWFGASSSELHEARDAIGRFPVSAVLTAGHVSEGRIYVEARAGDQVLARGNGAVRFDAAPSTVRIALSAACAQDSECADDVFCNGAEICVDGACATGPDPCLGGSSSCVTLRCVEPNAGQHGGCEADFSAGLDDGNPCTEDVCRSDGVFEHREIVSTDDPGAVVRCTTPQTLVPGTCVGRACVPVTCENGVLDPGEYCEQAVDGYPCIRCVRQVVADYVIFDGALFGRQNFCGIDSQGGAWCAFAETPEARRRYPNHGFGMPAQVYAASGEAGCAIRSNGEIKCFGHNTHGQISPNGDASEFNDGVRKVPTLMDDALGLALAQDSACASFATGVYCWGLGTLPTHIGPAVLGAFTKLWAGGQSYCALVNSGLACWKLQLPAAPTPQLKFSSGVREANVGPNEACAVLLDGSVWCWADRAAPHLELDPAQTGFAATRVATGANGRCAHLPGLGVRCWGPGYVAGPNGSFPLVPVSLPFDAIGAFHHAANGACAAELAGPRLYCWQAGPAPVARAVAE